MSAEPYGTTPLPAKGVQISYDPGEEVWDIAQQPKSQQIAAYEGLKTEDAVHGATVLDANQHFVIYAVKKGLIRILHRHSTLRSLFRGHEGQVVTDIQIFLDGDVLGSVGSANGSSTVIIWRVFERTPEIMFEKLLEITTSAYFITRLIWHPFNPNQFWIIHSKRNEGDDDKLKVASLVDTTRISTLPNDAEGHAVCMFYKPNIIMDGVVELSTPSMSSLTDLDWSEKDVRHVITTHHGGEIRLWDLRKLDHTVSESTSLPACLCLIQEEQPLSRCKFLPHESPRDHPSKREKALTTCFLTAAKNNSVVTLWSPFGEDETPMKLQVFGLENPSPSYLLDICFGPSPPDGPPLSLFVLMADQSDGKLFSWHLQSEWHEHTVAALVGCDYVVPFVTSFPMYSWSTQVQPAADISEDEMTDQGGLVFDMKLFSYQSTVVQCLILTSFMCLPPGSQWDPATPGVTVEDLQQEFGSAVASQGDLALSEDFEGEDYDIGEDDDGEEENGEEYNEPPAASSLPVPDGLESPNQGDGEGGTGSTNSFSNWLGALAVKTGPAPIPPPPVASNASAGAATTMLTPADLFPNHPSIQPNANGTTGTSDSRSSSRSQQQQNASNNQTKKTKNQKGSTSRSRSRSPKKKESASKQSNQEKKRQQSPQRQQQQQPEQNVSILQRKTEEPPPSAPLAPPPGIAPSAAVSKSDVAGSGMDVADLFRKQEAVIKTEIHKAVQDEIKSTLAPLIDQKVRDCVKGSIEPLISSIDSIGKDGVQVDHDKLVAAITRKVEVPLRNTFAENMKNVLIPAFESVSGQMFAQISSSLENGMAQKHAADEANKQELATIKSRLSAMTSSMNELTSQVEKLRSIVSEHGARGRTESLTSSLGANVAAEQQHIIENEVLALLGQRQYEAAFTKALSASTVEMALFVCRHADLSDVLGGNSPALSQPILLCLMHQLGTSVVTATNDGNNLQTELEWLQEVSLSINPADESMRRHLPGVLHQLVSGINDKMARTDQQAKRRPLQRLLQVLRGVQVQ